MGMQLKLTFSKLVVFTSIFFAGQVFAEVMQITDPNIQAFDQDIDYRHATCICEEGKGKDENYYLTITPPESLSSVAPTYQITFLGPDNISFERCNNFLEGFISNGVCRQWAIRQKGVSFY